MTSPRTQAERMAEETLPCQAPQGYGGCYNNAVHARDCPAFYRPALVALLEPLLAEREWINATAKLPDYGQKCWIAESHFTQPGEQVWIGYSGWRSEDDDDKECWFVDDDYWLSLDNTWWQPIVWPLHAAPTKES